MSAPHDPPPAPAPPPGAPAPRPLPRAPGARRARHLRWARVTKWVTAASLLAFGAGVAILVRGFLARPTEAEVQMRGCRDFLSGIASQVRKFSDSRHRLPKALDELRQPDLDNKYDPQPWDCWGRPIEYLRGADGKDFVLRSLGPDGTPDTADDLVHPPGRAFR